MESVTRKLIEYNGISKCNSYNIKNFTQVNKEYIFEIPSCNKDIYQVTKVWVNVCKDNIEIVKTPCGKSIEGQCLTGNKLLVCGTIKLKIEYIGCSTNQNIHTAYTEIPFSAGIVLPCNFNKNSYVKVSVCVEDIFTEKIDCRNIYNNITMTIIADIN